MFLYLLIFHIPLLAYIKGDAINRNKPFLVPYMAMFAIFVGISDMLGGSDRYVYGQIFDILANDITYNVPPEYSWAFNYYERGYSIITYIIALITENRYIYIFIITLLIYFSMYKTIEKNMINYPLALVLFMGMVFFFTFTYLRQVLAFSIAWLGINYLIDQKRFKFFIIVLLVCLLHKSGLIFVILYFVPLKNWKPFSIFTILVLCGLIGCSGITGRLYEIYVTYINIPPDTSPYSADSSVRIAYMLEVVFFAWIILANYKSIEPTRRNLIFLNASWIFCIILLLFIRSSDGGRIAWYFTVGIIYTVTRICASPKNRFREPRVLSYIMIVVMLALYARVYFVWQDYNFLYPYKTFLSDGYRSPDYARERYEYDTNYDQDKFYRPVFRFLK